MNETNMKHIFEINVSPWGKKYSGESDVSECRAEIEFTDTSISVYMTVKERDILMSVTAENGDVYKDSCMEFFFSPCPELSAAYFNFEVNPLGTMYSGYSPDGTRASSAPVCHDEIHVLADIEREKGMWSVRYCIPYDFIRRMAPEFDAGRQKYIKGNFYKCADGKMCPHYIVWKNIDAGAVPEPDFHRPEYFGRIEI